MQVPDKPELDASKVKKVRSWHVHDLLRPAIKCRAHEASETLQSLAQAMMELAATQQANQEAVRQREKELAAVKVGCGGARVD